MTIDNRIAAHNAHTNFNPSVTSVGLAVPEFTLLTPEVLLEFCKSKLESLDAQVRSGFLKQQRRSRLSGALSDLATSLNSKADKSSGGVAALDDGLKQQILKEFNVAIANAGNDAGLVKKLEAQRDKFQASAYPPEGDANNDARVADWEMQDLAEAVQSIQADANREGELEMIQLQAVMSQRQQALQMCTNMVQSLGQSAMGIAQNIGK